MDIDTDKIDEATLALLYLGLHERCRAWKSFDWDAMGRLYEKGFIFDPVGKAKSVMLTGPAGVTDPLSNARSASAEPLSDRSFLEEQ